VLFHDRAQAGRALADALRSYTGRDDVVVLALPRGGVPVGFEIARRVGAPLDVIAVRKLGAPGRRELAMGAVAGDVCVLNTRVVAAFRVGREEIDRATEAARRELERRERLYRGDRAPAALEGKVAILVDDGLATGSSMRAAAAAVRARRPALVVVAVPVAAAETCDELRPRVDELVCLATPEPFVAVGSWYERFEQTSDEEVRELLSQARQSVASSTAAPPPSSSTTA
jgi:putative phosphoribosyl transferase